MKSIQNFPRMRKMASLAHTGSVGGLLLLLGGVVLSLFVPSLSTLSLILMLAGVVISVLGIHYANLWVKRPRPEVSLDTELKGLTDSYRLYHYPELPYDHILLSPSGVFVLETVNLEGEFAYQDGKWKEKMTIGRAVRYIVEEHLGDPIRDALDYAANLEDHFKAEAGVKTIVTPLVVFINPRADILIKNAPVVVTTPKKLKSLVTSKSAKMPAEIIGKIQAFLDGRMPEIALEQG